MKIENLIVSINKKNIKIETKLELSKFINKTLNTVLSQSLKEFNVKYPNKAISKNKIKNLHLTEFEYDEKEKAIKWNLNTNPIIVYVFSNGLQRNYTELGEVFKENLEDISKALSSIIESCLLLTHDIFNRSEVMFNEKHDKHYNNLSEEDKKAYMNPFFKIQMNSILNTEVIFKGFSIEDFEAERGKEVISVESEKFFRDRTIIDELFTVQIKTKGVTGYIVCDMVCALSYLHKVYIDKDVKADTMFLDESIDALVGSMMQEVFYLENKYKNNVI